MSNDELLLIGGISLFFIIFLCLLGYIILCLYKFIFKDKNIEELSRDEIAQKIKDFGTTVSGVVEFFKAVDEGDSEKIRKSVDITANRIKKSDEER